MNKQWVVYIVECSDMSYYTGITNNLDHRIHQHNTGTGAKYTRGRTPVTLKRYEPMDDKSAACRAEYTLKKLTRKQKYGIIQGSLPVEQFLGN